jgi:anti-sigma regulatory factor (Ser/Thr protein kinase)
MPGIDGLELVKQARERFPLVPVVLMTAHGSEETAVEALGAGAASYVPKRRLATELSDTIESVLMVARGARDERRAYELLDGGELRHVLGPEAADVTALVRYFQRLLERIAAWDHPEVLQIGVALREALINAVEHGNLELDSALKDEGRYDELRAEREYTPPYKDRRVGVVTRIGPEKLTWVITDEGAGFTPDAVPDPTDPLNLDREWGRGLLLIRTFMDDVVFNGTGNEITMTKRRDVTPRDKRAAR